MARCDSHVARSESENRRDLGRAGAVAGRATWNTGSWLAVRPVCRVVRWLRRRLPAPPCAPRLSAQASHSPPTRCQLPVGDPARSNPQGNARPRWRQGRLKYTPVTRISAYSAKNSTFACPCRQIEISHHTVLHHTLSHSE
jgi:hypothetical protein